MQIRRTITAAALAAVTLAGTASSASAITADQPFNGVVDAAKNVTIVKTDGTKITYRHAAGAIAVHYTRAAGYSDSGATFCPAVDTRFSVAANDITDAAFGVVRAANRDVTVTKTNGTVRDYPGDATVTNACTDQPVDGA